MGRLDRRSRMSGDVHVRFCEHLGGRFPGVTRLVITGQSWAILEQDVMPLVTDFLRERGLVLAPEKTRIVHIDDGFDFLGFHFRKYGGKLLIKPARASINHVRERVKAVLQQGQHTSQTELTRTLGPILRGWGNYYRHVVSKVVFQKLDHDIWCLTWNWARRRHPQKSQRWVKDRYFPRQGARKWTFSDCCHTLVSLGYIPIRRHVLVRSGANPYDP